MDNKKINLVLWIGIAIPAIVIVVIFIMSIMSKQGFTPKYDFLYYFEDGYSYCYTGGAYYYVKDGQVNQAPKLNQDPTYCTKSNSLGDATKIYKYSVVDEKSYPLTLTEAQKLKIENTPISPAGESIQRDYGSDAGIFEIFGGRRYNSNNSYYLMNEQKRIKTINIVNQANINYYNLKFIGWIIK
jgi:hypothetical protein